VSVFGLGDLAFLGAASGSAYDADAQVYITAVETADGQALETAVKDAINAFVVGCKADGIWSAIKASCILAGARTLAGALVPLVGTAPTRFGAESGWSYNRKTGLQGNGINNYLGSNRNNNADPQNNKHVSVYANTSPSQGGTPIASGGWNSGGIGMTNLFVDVSGNRMLPRLNGDGPGGIIAGLPQAPCLIGASRSSSTGFTLRRNGTNTLVSYASQVPYNGMITVFGSDSYTNARLSFYSIGESLDLALLDARVTALINAFAAAIP